MQSAWVQKVRWREFKNSAQVPPKCPAAAGNRALPFCGCASSKDLELAAQLLCELVDAEVLACPTVFRAQDPCFIACRCRRFRKTTTVKDGTPRTHWNVPQIIHPFSKETILYERLHWQSHVECCDKLKWFHLNKGMLPWNKAADAFQPS